MKQWEPWIDLAMQASMDRRSVVQVTAEQFRQLAAQVPFFVGEANEGPPWTARRHVFGVTFCVIDGFDDHVQSLVAARIIQ